MTKLNTIIQIFTYLFLVFPLNIALLSKILSCNSISKSDLITTCSSGVESLYDSTKKEFSYRIEGMSCNGCSNRIQDYLRKTYDPEAVVSFQHKFAKLKVPTQITSTEINKQLLSLGNYHAFEITQPNLLINYNTKPFMPTSLHKLWQLLSSKFQLFKPLLAIFCGITLVSLCLQYNNLPKKLNGKLLMRHFMGIFYITFSCFKMINLKGFAETFSTYDIVAMKWRVYSFLYPFIELLLGILYLSNQIPGLTNVCALFIKMISDIGVFAALRQNKVLQCACLGTSFNLPMTYVTLLEDTLMVGMALAALVHK